MRSYVNIGNMSAYSVVDANTLSGAAAHTSLCKTQELVTT
jgi:hypothetical protein